MSDEAPREAITCPVCRMENPTDAVFCENPACHKALGEFAYVAEQMSVVSTRLEKTADNVARFTAHPHFVTVHVVWFVAWIALNSGAVTLVMAFDAYPYSLLGILLSVEAILVTGFLLISQGRQTRHAELRAELDYEVNVRSFRKLLQVETAVGRLTERLAALEERNSAIPG